MKWNAAIAQTDIKQRDISSALEQLAGSAIALKSCIDDGDYELEPLLAEVSRMRDLLNVVSSGFSVIVLAQFTS